MTRSLRNIILTFAYLVLLGSCRKDREPVIDSSPASFSDLFEVFWEKMNSHYVYWDIDSTDWTSTYYKYKPIFQQLDLKNNDDIKRSFGYFRDMTAGLTDNHFFISFQHPLLADSLIYPSFERKKKAPGFHYPYSYYKIDTSYLDKSFRLGFDNNYSVNGEPLTVLSGTINGNILFFHANRFSLFKSYHSVIDNEVKDALDYFFNEIKGSSVSYKGIILDVRGNQGGDVSDLNFILGRLIGLPLKFGYTSVKRGNGKTDYTPWIDSYVNPQPGSVQTKIPITVLADNVSASLSEALVMAVHTMPGSRFVGEKTWGATGPVVSEEVFNSGPFIIPGFMSVQASSCRFKYIDGRFYEDRGFVPDIPVPFNKEELSAGKDAALEKAIGLFR